MTNRLILSVALFMMGLLALAACWADAATAMGTPTENYTITDLPNSNSGYAPIKPSVNFVPEGPSYQSDNRTPAFIASLISPEANNVVKSGENWFLDLDINMPGWLYIYEYYPPDYTTGSWVSYKWLLPQSARWRLGPFSPTENTTDGQHIYRIWFYNNGQWAAEDPNGPRDNQVKWTFVKISPAVQTPVQAPPAVSHATPADNQFYRFITNPLVLLFGPSVIVIIVLSLWIYGRRRARPVFEPQQAEPLSAEPPLIPAEEKSPVIAQPGTARASLSMPNGLQIKLDGSRTLGRGEFARSLDLDDLALISRKHFTIEAAGDRFSIEDKDSANGTQLNGADIRGKGPSELNDGDIIEPAGAIKLTFHVL